MCAWTCRLPVSIFTNHAQISHACEMLNRHVLESQLPATESLQGRCRKLSTCSMAQAI